MWAVAAGVATNMALWLWLRFAGCGDGNAFLFTCHCTSVVTFVDMHKRVMYVSKGAFVNCCGFGYRFSTKMFAKYFWAELVLGLLVSDF